MYGPVQILLMSIAWVRNENSHRGQGGPMHHPRNERASEPPPPPRHLATSSQIEIQEAAEAGVGSLRHQLPDLSLVGDDVQLPLCVLAERGHAPEAADVPLRLVADLAVLPAERPQPAAAVVGIEDGAREVGQGAAAVRVATGHRAAVRVLVLDRRLDAVLGAGPREAEAVRALAHVPAVVGARARRIDDVHLLVLV